MKILILSFFYPPDIGPKSVRAKTIIDALQKYGPKELNINLITSFSAQTFDEVERHDNLTIYRIKIPKFKSNFLYQLYTFTCFFIKTLLKVRSEKYDLIVTTSGRLGTAFLGAVIAKQKSAKFYLDLREIFPENIKDVFNGIPGTLLNKVFSWLERWIIHAAHKVNLISPGFTQYYQKKYPDLSFSNHMHAVEDLFRNIPPAATSGSRLKICYAGNIGYGQQLHLILPELAKRTSDRFDFHIIGGGNTLKLLERTLKEKEVQNITLIPEMPRNKLIAEYQTADILFLHFYPYSFASRILPSKLFEYAATDKPIWAGVTGYAEQFIKQEISNCVVFKPCNADDALLAFETLELKPNNRIKFYNKFNQDHLMRALAQEILSLLN